MTDTKYNRLVTRIFWFVLPLIVGLLTFLVVNTFAVKEGVTEVAIKNDVARETQNKMWDLIQQNNEILQSKADEKTNDDAHKILMEDLRSLQKKVDLIYIQNKNTYSEVDNVQKKNNYIPRLDSAYIQSLTKMNLNN